MISPPLFLQFGLRRDVGQSGWSRWGGEGAERGAGGGGTMCRPVPSRWTIVFWASPERDGRRCPCTRAGLPSFIRHFTSPCPAPAPKVSSRPPLCLPLSSLFISRVLSNVSATFVTFFFFYGTQSPKSSLSVGLFCLPLSREQAQGPGPDRRRMPTAFFLSLIFLGDTQRGPQSRRS